MSPVWGAVILIGALACVLIVAWLLRSPGEKPYDRSVEERPDRDAPDFHDVLDD